MSYVPSTAWARWAWQAYKDGRLVDAPALPAVQPVTARIDWHPIAETPPNGPVLLWYGKADFLKPADPLEPGRETAMRMEVGYTNAGVILEAWTGHSMFADWREAEITHWAVHPGGPSISEGQQP